ncbi:MAG: cation-translocating P-type ATPase [Synergistaceae bacterium]
MREKTEIKMNFKVTGMTCTTCSKIVERTISKIEGVTYASVNLATESVFVVASPEVTFDEISNAVKKSGYGISKDIGKNHDEEKYKKARNELIFIFTFGLPVSVLMIMHMIYHVAIPNYTLIEIAAGAIVIFIGAHRTLKGAWIAGIHSHTNMDTLITISSVASWITAVLVFYGYPIPSFGTVGIMIIMMHYLGRFIESKLRDKAAKQIKKLLTLQPREARVIRDNQALMVPIDAVKPQSIIQINPGERIPLDGIIIKGQSDIDESLLTGEPLPVHKEENSEVTSGAMNLSGVIKVETTKLGEDTFLSKMLELVREAQGSKIPLQAVADRITLVFVPAVLTLAIASAIAWYIGFNYLYALVEPYAKYLPWGAVFNHAEPINIAIYSFVATLVIACPCALGLATPIALVSSTGEASRNGLLIRNAEAIQTLHRANCIILDKTGTLTMGKTTVISCEVDTEEKPYIYSLEANSGHPLAKAIKEDLGTLAARNATDPDSVKEIPGDGIYGRWGKDEWFIGKTKNRNFWENKISTFTTLVEVRKNSEPIAYFEIADSIRSDTPNAIKDLKLLGITPIMATGDSKETAEKIANESEITEVYSGVLPKDKLDIVQREQAKGKKVIMVGDGINDAAALKGADIGIAIGAGMDLAVDNSDIVILSGGISKVVSAVKISRITWKIIIENLFFAFLYNTIAIPLAMSGLLHPVVAEVAMAISSITVVLNSLRIIGSAERN